MRLRRLCFEILALRLFFREPIQKLDSFDIDPTTETVSVQLLLACRQQRSAARYSINLVANNEKYRAGGI